MTAVHVAHAVLNVVVIIRGPAVVVPDGAVVVVVLDITVNQLLQTVARKAAGHNVQN